MVYIWYYHFAISSCYSILRCIIIKDQGLNNTVYEILAICCTTVVFSFVERVTKENWVLFDSFKRAQKIYMKLIDQLPIPTFVTDSAGRVVYCNSFGKALYDNTRPISKSVSNKSWNFLELVYESYKKAMEDFIKQGCKNKIEPIEIPLLSEMCEARMKQEISEEVKDDPKPAEHKLAIADLGLNPQITDHGTLSATSH